MSTAEPPQEEPSPSSRQRGGGEQPTGPSPRSGTNSAPIRHERAVPALAFRHHYRSVPRGGSGRHAHHHHHPRHQLISASLSPPLLSSSAPNNNTHYNNLPNSPSALSSSPLQHLSLSASAGGGSPSTASHSPALRPRRLRPVALGRALSLGSHSSAPTTAPAAAASSSSQLLQQQQRPLFTASLSPRFSQKKLLHHTEATQQTQLALQQNDAMVYLEGPNVYACQQCRTHLTSHDDIISKSFHGRNGRAYLLNSAVNVRIGPSEDRMLMTGLHSVCDIFCQRCNTLIGWTYQKAYEASQKYKEGKFIIEKINLYLDDQDGEGMSGGFDDNSSDPFKERRRRRSSSDDNHGNNHHKNLCPNLATDVYEYYPPPPASSSSETTSARSAGRRSSSTSLGTGAASF